MPTKLISKALLGALSAALMAAPAFAGGNCGGGNCAVPVKVLPSMPAKFGPMTIRNENPLGHLRTIDFQRAPNVSITRIHGLAPTAGLADAPTGFTNGCHPNSTTYCRQHASLPAQVQFTAPAPVLAQAPVLAPPVVSAPRVIHTGQGYDPSKFAPRTYGDASLVPGVAYLPTSTVVRDPAAAQQVLDSGQAVPQPVVVPGTGTAPNLGMVRQNIGFQNTAAFRGAGFTQTQGLFLAPTPQGAHFGQAGAPILQQSGPFAGSFGSTVGADGTYWEKVSGPTAFGDTVATSVICKRQLQTRVVRPVVGVPVPVRVPVAVPQGCQSVAPQGGGLNTRYGQGVSSRWTR